MDINPLDQKATHASTGSARRQAGDGGFQGVMALMAHLASADPSRTDDPRRTRETDARPVDRPMPARLHDREPIDGTATETADETDEPRSDFDSAPSLPAIDQAAHQPAQPPTSAAGTANPSGGTPPAPVADATAGEMIPPVPAPQAAAVADAATADTGAPAATPQRAAVQPATAEAAPNAASSPVITPPTADPAAPARGPRPSAPTPRSDGPAGAAATTATLTPQIPTADTPRADMPRQSALSVPIGHGANPPAAAPQVTGQIPPQQGPAPQVAANQLLAAAPSPETARPQAARPQAGRAQASLLPPEIKVSVETAPVVARAQGVSSAVLVQAHMAAAGESTGKAVAQAASGQTVPLQNGTALHVGGNQPTFVGGDASNPQAGSQPGGQNAGSQNGGGQANGGQAQPSSSFAFGAATIGQRGFGGDAARAQFQEILSTRMARAPLQGGPSAAGGSSAASSSLAFTAGPGGPQSTLSSAMASRAEATAQGRPGALPSTAVGQVAVKLTSTAADGGGRITIRLNPEELGKVDVKLELGRDGTVHARISAERPETLDMLQRDARVLEKALQEAGLKTDQNSLEFDLRGGNGQPTDRDGQQQLALNDGPASAEDGGADDAPATEDAADDGGVRADGSYDLVA